MAQLRLRSLPGETGNSSAQKPGPGAEVQLASSCKRHNHTAPASTGESKQKVAKTSTMQGPLQGLVAPQCLHDLYPWQHTLIGLLMDLHQERRRFGQVSLNAVAQANFGWPGDQQVVFSTSDTYIRHVALLLLVRRPKGGQHSIIE